MRPRYAWLVGLVVGVGVGTLLGLRRGDVGMALALGFVWAVAGYGFLAFPEYRTTGGNSGAWYALVGAVTPLVMLLPTAGPILGDAGRVPLVALLGGTWLGGVYAGVALERRTRARNEA